MKIVRVPALFLVLLVLCGTLAAALLFAATAGHEHNFYLGFDRNDYPGDDSAGAVAQDVQLHGILAECAAGRENELVVG